MNDLTTIGEPVAELLQKRYALDKEIGRGGFGVVYLARDMVLDGKQVVVKVLTAPLDDNWAGNKFREEMRAMARIDHPGIVGVQDRGETRDGSPYLVLQYVKGNPLREVLKDGRVNPSRVSRIAGQLAEALDAAHEKKVIHRDLKPENIMIERAGEEAERAVIIDFGIASIVEAGQELSTRVAGTMAYMAPEQFQGKARAESDNYALAVILFEMLTGKRPFGTDREFSPIALWGQQIEGPELVRGALAAAGFPPGVQEVMAKAFAFQPEGRYSAAAELAGALRQALEAPAVLAQSAAAGAGGSATPSGGTTIPAESDRGVELASVLFLDIVQFSLKPIQQQKRIVDELQEMVRQSSGYTLSRATGGTIARPTGDGLVLAFFGDPMASVRCAVDVARKLRERPEVQVRMGVHIGLVSRRIDIAGEKDVVGGGINIAQRVMDAGDAGHILVSQAAADVIGENEEWAPWLHDIGEHKVKHGVRLHLFNLYGDGAGRAERPVTITGGRWKWLRRAAGAAAVLAVVALAVMLATRGPERSFSYYIQVQKVRNDAPFGEPFRLSGSRIFEADYRLELVYSSAENGYLYILNERPTAGILTGFTVISPIKGESAELKPNQQRRETVSFDNEKGVEVLWAIWSARPLPELEAVKEWATTADVGDIRDPRQVREVRRILEKHASSGVRFEDGARRSTFVKGRSEVLVDRLALEHQ